jgi:two-component system, LytTR family, sensor kinase
MDCEGCRRSLATDLEVHRCSYGCTFCEDCAAGNAHICPHCGGELMEQSLSLEPSQESGELITGKAQQRQIWLASFGVWTFVSIAATATIYELYRPLHNSFNLKEIAGMEFSQILTYAPLTPFFFMLALRFPIQRENWRQRSLLHLLFGIAFTIGHILLKAATPYGYWDRVNREWTVAIWDTHTHTFRPLWPVLQSMFLSSVVDDLSGAYASIALVAHALSYYRKSRQGELRAAQLEAQLAKARLQSLKSQLQPHFLFNTMHSISALMHSNVRAADQMICRLGDLLRITLDSVGTQITTLRGELEFVNCYLEIEKVRLEDRLQIYYAIAPEMLDAQVPHLLLQPLVDNAVKHGISKIPGGGQICISARDQGNSLLLTVENDGIVSAAKTGNLGVGLKVTRERLYSLYGDHYSLDFLTSDNRVTISISIPLRLQPPSGDREQEMFVSEKTA